MSSDFNSWAGRYVIPPVINIDTRSYDGVISFSVSDFRVSDAVEEVARTLLQAVARFTGQADIFAVLLKNDEFFAVQLRGDVLRMQEAELTVTPVNAAVFYQAGLRLCIDSDVGLSPPLQQSDLHAEKRPEQAQLTVVLPQTALAHETGQLFYTSDYSVEQLQQLLSLWLNPEPGHVIKGPPAASPASSLYDCFLSQVKRQPEALALQMGEERLSRSELVRRVECVAMQLATEVPRNHCVALALPKSVELVVATLACNAAGVIAMPLVEDISLERLRYQLSDANCQYVLGRLDYTLEGITQRPLAGPEPALAVDLQPLALDDVNTLYYTSGSEGKPKGVMLPGRAFHRLVIDSDFFDVQPDDRFGYFANPAFDAAALEVWAALLNGVPLVLFQRDTLLDLHHLESQIADTGVNSGFFTTGLFNRIADLHAPLFRHFRQVFFGGEKASVQALRAALRASPDTRYINGYGPTENGVYTCCQCVDQDHARRFDIAIGTPIAGTDIVLVDEQLEPVPVGATGQLVCLGDGLADGYVNQPQLSAERFIRWRNRPAYLSGDLARLNEQGGVEYIGRIDDQIKLNGYRIEPGEIEVLLRGQPDVQRVCVRLDEETRQLQAWLTPQQADTEAARQVCQQLPTWMRPAKFMTLEELPLNANGKVDHRHLRRLGQQAKADPDSSAQIVETSMTPVQQRLLALYADILKQPVHHLDASLFELGGNSLHMMSLLAQLREQWQLSVSLEALANASSPRQVAQLIELLDWHEHGQQSNQSDSTSTQLWEF